MSTLIERLQAGAPELARRTIAEMYDNPFWQERFGSSGRENADRDGQYHLTYLIQALAANDASVLTSYARWLQTLLVSRGMSSRHIAENFDRLARAIGRDVSESAPALELLAAATQALVYDAGPARELQTLAARLARVVVDELERSHTAWFAAASSYPSLASLESIERAERARFEEEVLDFIAYLADALHAARPELFVRHVLWTHGYQVRRRAPLTRVKQTLLALRDCLTAPPKDLSVAPELAVQAALVIDTAVEGLQKPPASAAPGSETSTA